MSANVFVGISVCSFASTPITDVTQVRKSESGQRRDHFVDAHRHPTLSDEFAMSCRVEVDTLTFPENFGLTRGAKGTLIWTGKNRDGGSDKTYTCTTARFVGYGESRLHNADEAGGSLIFLCASADGDTQPFAVT
jgi:hypothetical protein